MYVIIKSLPTTPHPVLIIAVVLFLIGIPLALLSKAITARAVLLTRRERYTEADARRADGSRVRQLRTPPGRRHCAATPGWSATTRWRSTTAPRCTRPGSAFRPAAALRGRPGAADRDRVTASDLNRCDLGLTALAAPPARRAGGGRAAAASSRSCRSAKT